MDHPTPIAKPRHPRLTAQQAQQLLDEQALSGVGIMAFCRDHGVSYARLKYWRGRLATRREASPVDAGFVELVPASRKSAHDMMVSAGVMIRVSDDCRIEVSRGFDAVVLRAVVEALR
jgi:kynurenine formamidase